MKNEKFDLNAQYTQYLQRVGLSEAKMHPVQNKVMKNAFMGACGIMLVTLRDDLGAIEDDMEAIKIMEDMFSQVGNHFISQN